MISLPLARSEWQLSRSWLRTLMTAEPVGQMAAPIPFWNGKIRWHLNKTSRSD